MSVNTILVNHPGPLPISIQYVPKSDVLETLAFSGSVSTHDIAMLPNGFEVKVNGETAGKSIIYCGQDGRVKHQATIATMVNYDIPFVVKDGVVQPVTIELVPASSDSESDSDDYYNLAIIT